MELAQSFFLHFYTHECVKKPVILRKLLDSQSEMEASAEPKIYPTGHQPAQLPVHALATFKSRCITVGFRQLVSNSLLCILIGENEV